MHDIEGRTVWSAELNCYGQVENLVEKAKDCPFRYPGQYEDVETGLYYNRFRYYSPEEVIYISQDPIGLAGGDKLYGYVHDPNSWIDQFGLNSTLFRGDNFYKGGDIGIPLGSNADIMTPWEHVRRESKGETSIFTSFSDKKGIAEKFGKVCKDLMKDLKILEAEGKIKIHTPESVAHMMKNSGNKKLITDANNVKQIMLKNGEFLIEGIIEQTIQC